MKHIWPYSVILQFGIFIRDVLYTYIYAGSEYAGTCAVSISGSPCLPWSEFNMTHLARNYCRNPDNDPVSGPWCYTAKPQVWERSQYEFIIINKKKLLGFILMALPFEKGEAMKKREFWLFRTTPAIQQNGIAETPMYHAHRIKHDKACLIQSQFFTRFWREVQANTMDYDYKSRPNNTRIAVLVSYFILEACYNK